MAPRRSTRLVKADTAPATNAPTAKASTSKRARIPQSSSLIKPWHPTRSASELPADVLREVALILHDVHRSSVTALASTCRLIDDVIAPVQFEVVRFERYRGPPKLGARPKDKRKRKRKDDASDDDSGVESAEERWQERKAEVAAWTDVVARYVGDVVPGRGHLLRYLYFFDQSERRVLFARLLAAAPIRFLGLTLCRDSNPEELGLANCTSIEALQIATDDAHGMWSGPQDSPRMVAGILDALPDLQELVLIDIHSAAAPRDQEASQAMFSSAVWRLSQLHALTLNRCKTLNAPSSTDPRPPIMSLTLRLTSAGRQGRWTSSVTAEAPSDALIEAFAPTLEELVSALRPSADVLSLPNLTSFTDLSETTQAARIRNSPVRYYETSTTHAPEIVGGAFAAGMWGVNRAAHPFASAPEPNLAALEQLLDDPTALTALTELNLRRAHEPYYYQPWRLEDHVDGLIDRLSRRGASLFINGSETVAEAGTE